MRYCLAFLKEKHAMNKHSLKLAWLSSAVLVAAALAAPASAQDPAAQYCAVLVDNTGTKICISNVGTAVIRCHGVVRSPDDEDEENGTICGEAFAICLKGGSSPVVKVIHQGILNPVFTVVGLTPATTGGGNFKPGNCIPFIQTLINDGGKNGFKTTVLQPELDGNGNPILDEDCGAPVFDTSSLPLGTKVQVVVINPPTGDNSLGVQTAFQFITGTCKLCKTRKIFNTGDPKTICMVKEFELTCDRDPVSFGPINRLTTAALTSENQFITLRSTGNTGAVVKAGSVDGPPENAAFLFEISHCFVTNRFEPPGNEPDKVSDESQWLELALDFCALIRDSKGKPIAQGGGVTLKTRQEKFLTFCIDVE
jgi:hypothetical protein